MKHRANLMNLMKLIFLNRKNNFGIKTIILAPCVSLLLFIAAYTAKAQPLFERTAPNTYRIVFTDKNESPYSIHQPDEFLSQRAIARRQKQNIPVLPNDLPVNPAYLDSLKSTGVSILTVSKWFNAVTIKESNDSILNRIAEFPFVLKDTESAWINDDQQTGQSTATQELDEEYKFDYGKSWGQTTMLKGDFLHRNGYTGQDMVIAILDAGFLNADRLPVFNRLFERGQILGTRDFVKAGNDVFRESSHGMSVLSIIGGYLPGELVGTAPDASFWLLRSEDARTEYRIEEDNWIAAAEFADSAGADVINSSLGYALFNDSLQNHSYENMDGNTTRITRAADIAASKGIIVVNSAGNQGDAKWRYITAPGDADSIITVGAVDASGYLASFSSRGPTPDNRVKPTVVALGKGTFVARLDSSIGPGNGTSFSAPVIAGLTACLWESLPEASNMEVIQSIIKSSDRADFPGYDYGYGIPNFAIAGFLLKADYDEHLSDFPVVVFPNPFTQQLHLFFEAPINDQIHVQLFDITGKQIFNKDYPGIPGRTFMSLESDFSHLQKGAYIIKVKSGNISGHAKLIKY